MGFANKNNLYIKPDNPSSKGYFLSKGDKP